MTAHTPNNQPSPIDAWIAILPKGLPLLRSGRKWSQHDLAYHSGLARSTIARLEHLSPDVNGPDEATLRALAHAFQYPDVSDLWRALEGAVSGSSVPPTHIVLTGELLDLVSAYMDCTAEQRQLLRSLAHGMAARHKAHLKGEDGLLDLESLLHPKRRPTKR